MNCQSPFSMKINNKYIYVKMLSGDLLPSMRNVISTTQREKQSDSCQMLAFVFF